MSFAALRESITDLFAGISANVYWWVPEVVMSPAIVLVPDNPYIEILPIKRGNYKVTYKVTALVSVLDNKAALANLEDLILDALAALPAGYQVGSVSDPTVINLGQADLLASEFTVSIIGSN